MYILSKSNVTRFLIGLVAAMAAIALTMSAQAGGSTVSVGSNSISASTNVTNGSSIVIRVAGPGGYFSSQQSDTDYIIWDAPYGLPDGEYRYEVFVTVGSETEGGSSTQLHRETGRFTVQGGSMSVKQASPDPKSSIQHQKPTIVGSLVTGIIDFFIPSAQAANVVTNPGDVKIIDATPWLFFEDTSTTDDGDGYDWLIYTEHTGTASGYFRVWDDNSNSNVLNFSSGTSDSANRNSLAVDSSGNIGLADDTVYIDKFNNWIGIGTVTPTRNLHLFGDAPAVVLQDSSGKTWTLNRDGNSGVFDISWKKDATSDTASPFTLRYPAPENSIYVQTTGFVGMGTANPSVPLHVTRNDGTASLLVDEVSVTTAPRIMQRLRNNGPTALFLEDTSVTGGTWSFMLNSNNFVINNVAAGGLKIVAAADNSYRIKNKATGVETMKVTANGNMAISGILYTGSSRTIKDNIDTVENSSILTKLDELPVSYWNYKTTNADDRHIGPMAEDFYELFGLGTSNKYVAPGDLAGIALAAAKALNEKSTIKDDQISKLSKENEQIAKTNDELKLRIHALEAKVADLIQVFTMNVESLNTVAAAH